MATRKWYYHAEVIRDEAEEITGYELRGGSTFKQSFDFEFVTIESPERLDLETKSVVDNEGVLELQDDATKLDDKDGDGKVQRYLDKMDFGRRVIARIMIIADDKEMAPGPRTNFEDLFFAAIEDLRLGKLARARNRIAALDIAEPNLTQADLNKLDRLFQRHG